MTPGIATGVTDEPLKHPALPKEAPWPGSSASTRKTLWPSRCSQLAAHTPTMPAPITPTRLTPPLGIRFPSSSREMLVASAHQTDGPAVAADLGIGYSNDTERCRSGRTGRSRNAL